MKLSEQYLWIEKLSEPSPRLNTVKIVRSREKTLFTNYEIRFSNDFVNTMKFAGSGERY